MVLGNDNSSCIMRNKFSVRIHIPDTGGDGLFNGNYLSVIGNIDSARAAL